MKIAKYIGDLIYDYECVVIPGLGGFISTAKSAEVNQVTNQFTPPYKDVHFNIHLKANDGLLVNYVARNEEISFKSAKHKVDKFALLCHNALKEGKRINFSKIGYIFQDDQENIVFKQDKSINYNADAFGLSSFVSPAIRRPNSEEKIKDVFSKKNSSEGNQKGKERNSSTKRKDKRSYSKAGKSHKMTARSRPSTIKRQLLFVFIILFAYGTYYTINHRHAMLYYWDRHQAKIPLLYSNPNDYLVANAGILPLDKLNISQFSWVSGLLNFSNNIANDDDYSNSKDITAEKQTVELTDEVKLNEVIVEQKDDVISSSETITIVEPEVEVIVVNEKVAPAKSLSLNRFFIIAGSFKSKNNADKLVVSLKKQGYNAAVADTNANGMFRVAYMGFGNRAEAEHELIAVRRESNSQAWILKK